MNKRGLSLVELIGVLVILSIVVSLTALIINLFIQANTRITINAQANYEGNLVIRKIEEDLTELAPTTYSTCWGTCFSLEREFSYELNPVSGLVELEVYSNPETYQIRMRFGILYINNESYDFGDFILNSDSYLTMTTVGSYNYLEILIVLESQEGYTYEFMLNFDFEEQVIPND